MNMQFTFNNVHIESLAVHLPEAETTSLTIEERLSPLYTRLGLVPGRLELMTGIKTRRFWAPGTSPSVVAAEAGRKALSAAGIDPQRIGCLMNTSVSRDCLEPATANMVHEILDLPGHSLVLDLSNACLGFLNGMVFAGELIEQGRIEAALITAGENGGPLVDSTINALNNDLMLTRRSCKNSFASLTIGSGAVAAVLTHSAISSTTHRLRAGVVRNDTRQCRLCMGGGGQGAMDTGVADTTILMETDSEELLHRGIDLARETFNGFLELPGVSRDTIRHVFTHQVGAAHRKLLYEGLQLNPDLDWATAEFLGNMGSVSLPATMALGVEARRAQSGDTIALLGIGSGINCMMLDVEW